MNSITYLMNIVNAGGDTLAVEIILPKLTYEMQAGRILEWLCLEGQNISMGQALFVVETDKATTEVSSDLAGVLLKIEVPAGVDVPVGSTVAWVGLAGEIVQSKTPHPTTPASQKTEAIPTAAVMDQVAGAATEDALPDRSDQIIATPIAKRMARELNVDLKDVVQYTGRLRVRETDILAYDEARKNQPTAGSQQPTHTPLTVNAKPADKPAAQLGGEFSGFQLIQPTPVQKAMAAHLGQSVLIPQAAAGCELDLSKFEDFRDQLQAGWEKKFGFRLSYTHLIAALTAGAIKAYPLLNASWTDQGIRLYQGVNLGIAMNSQRGQFVPVVQRADELSLGNLAVEIVRLQTALNNNRLANQDIQGGTMTLTNVGMLGIELSIPVLNPPQSAILGVGARRTKLVLDNGQIKTIPVMSVTLVVDHRMVVGSMQGAFLKTFREFIENPALVLST